MSSGSVSTDRRFGVNAGVAVKAPCIDVATANITLSGLQTLPSGYTTQEGDRILVIGQTDQTQNGIYYADVNAWNRTPDFDGEYDVVQGTLITVATNGTVVPIYAVTTPAPIVFGTSLITIVVSDTSGGYAAEAAASAQAAANSAIQTAAAVVTCNADAASATASATSASNSATSAQTNALAAQSYLAPVTGTSSTSLTIGTGTQSFTTQTGLAFVPGHPIKMVEIANPAVNTMIGTVNSYNSATGAMACNITAVTGSGTYSDWSLFLVALGGSGGSSGAPGIAVVSALPSGQPIGTVVYNTTDNKLYRWTGTAWISWIAAADILGTLTAAQIASVAAASITGTLTAAQVAAVNASAIAGQLTAAQIASITAAQVTGASWTGSQIAAGTITAGNIAASAVTATQLAAGAVTAASIATGAVTAGAIAANTITSAQIAAGTITGANIAAGTIQAGNIAATTITGNLIAANTIVAANLASGTITAGSGVIANAAIGTLQVAGNAITVTVGAATSSPVATTSVSTTYTLISAPSATADGSTPFIVFGHTGTITLNGAVGLTPSLQITRNGTVIAQFFNPAYFTNGQNVTFQVQDTPPAGAVVYAVTLTTGNGSGGTTGSNVAVGTAIQVLGTKR